MLKVIITPIPGGYKVISPKSIGQREMNLIEQLGNELTSLRETKIRLESELAEARKIPYLDSDGLTPAQHVERYRYLFGDITEDQMKKIMEGSHVHLGRMVAGDTGKRNVNITSTSNTSSWWPWSSATQQPITEEWNDLGLAVSPQRDLIVAEKEKEIEELQERITALMEQCESLAAKHTQSELTRFHESRHKEALEKELESLKLIKSTDSDKPNKLTKPAQTCNCQELPVNIIEPVKRVVEPVKPVVEPGVEPITMVSGFAIGSMCQITRITLPITEFEAMQAEIDRLAQENAHLLKTITVVTSELQRAQTENDELRTEQLEAAQMLDKLYKKKLPHEK